MFVLVGGRPASGRTTLARELAEHLALPLISRDDIQDVLVASLGPPATEQDAQRLGRTAVRVMLRLAGQCPSAVLDGRWQDQELAEIAALPGRIVEVRCSVPLEVAQARYRARTARCPAEERCPAGETAPQDEQLWSRPFEPLGLGTALFVDTTRPVDAAALAVVVRQTAAAYA